MGAAAQAQIEDLNNQMMEMKLTVEGLEKERDFYFGETGNISAKMSSRMILLQESYGTLKSCARSARGRGERSSER